MMLPDHDQPFAGLPGDAAGMAACSRCGRALSSAAASGLGCLTCLLADGLEEGADELPVASLAAGERFGDFALEHDSDGSPRELGHGAMGTTYLARDTVLDRPVALKVINAAATVRSGARARFLREAKGAAALRLRRLRDAERINEGRGERFQQVHPSRIRRSAPKRTPCASKCCYTGLVEPVRCRLH